MPRLVTNRFESAPTVAKTIWYRPVIKICFYEYLILIEQFEYLVLNQRDISNLN